MEQHSFRFFIQLENQGKNGGLRIFGFLGYFLDYQIFLDFEIEKLNNNVHIVNEGISS
jgi:hypothetical protein